ncbi:MAG: ATP-binding protein [Anaerolineae bacterium]|nr:ATP-binding protein [Anaerolineae bacterium]
MEKSKISVKQKIGETKGNSQVKGVELNVYSYFKATPAALRRSFDALMKDKLQGFVGRQFVFDALDDFLHSHDSGYFILRGVPGIGKSAFMAKLVNERGYIHHFNVVSQNIRGTRTFLENVIAQLIACYDLPYEELPPRALDDSGFLMQCLNEAAATYKSSEERIVIAIDALDEADRLGLAAAVNMLYLPATLPKGVYIIVTTRPLDDMRLQTMQQQILDLEADSEGNLQDITTYIETYIQREGMQKRLAVWGVSGAQFVAGLRKKSQGNFMYLYCVLPAIEHGEFVNGTLDELPDGLMAYYQRHWRQMREGNKTEFDTVYEPIVCILGVAQEPVTVQQISNWTKLNQGQVKENIRRWREFLEEEQTKSERKYRIYHASFQDFLREQVDLVRYDDMIADYYLELAGFSE